MRRPGRTLFSRCRPQRLSALVDGELTPRQAARVQAHVSACATCSAAVSELVALKESLATLASEGGDDNWSLLVNRLAQPAPSVALAQRVRRWPSLRYLTPILALTLCATGTAGWLRHERGRGLSADAVIAHAEKEFRAADAHYRRAIEELRTVAEAQRQGWPLPKRAEYDAAQAQLEAAVTRCRAIAEERPADVDAEELLFTAYQKEIRFYEDQMMREAQ